MAITIGATVSSFGGAIGLPTQNLSHTVDSGRKPLLVVGVVAYNPATGIYETDSLINAVTFAGRQLFRMPLGGGSTTTMWALLDAPVGAGTVGVQMQNGRTGVIIAANLYGAEIEAASKIYRGIGTGFGFAATTVAADQDFAGRPYLSTSLGIGFVSKLNTEAITPLGGETVLLTQTATGISGTLFHKSGTTFVTSWSWATGANCQLTVCEIISPRYAAALPTRGLALPTRGLALPTHVRI